jgi:cell fate (sporulation/competence/biofilm development) regulator YlbF (YheA/YmcA/DUF963 family)
MSAIAIESAAKAFADTLRQSEPVAAFWEARARLEADHQTKGLLTRLSECQRALGLKQRTGQEITQGDIDTLRSLQAEAQDSAILQAYSRALQKAQRFLPAVSAEISGLLGLDFAGLARAAGLYCPLPSA